MVLGGDLASLCPLKYGDVSLDENLSARFLAKGWHTCMPDLLRLHSLSVLDPEQARRVLVTSNLWNTVTLALYTAA